ncbi:MAG TPA: DUF177 domain-containing protein [Allosphingosinicella sp.]|jgi:uncharacterized metal-binding protein YceD (DUF177 family)
MVEFSRTFRIDTIGGTPRGVAIDANESERTALAARFGLEAIHALTAEAVLTRDGESVVAKGRVTASVVQSCVATGEPVEEDVAEDFAIEFRPQVQADSGEEEIELSEGELDVVFYDAAAVDLGEAVAETVSLALNPFPRSAKADEVLRAAGVKSEEEAKAEASPFAGLVALKGKLGK